MRGEIREILDDIEDGVDEERAGPVLSAGEELRRRIETSLEDRRLETEDPLLARRRRLHQRLEVLEAKVRAGRFEETGDDVEAVTSVAEELFEEIQARPAAREASPRLPRGPRRGLLVARREATRLLRGPKGALLAGLSVLVFGLGLLAARGSADSVGVLEQALEPALVLGPLAGVWVGVGSLADDVRESRLHLVTGQGLSRAGVLWAKALGAWLGLALGLLVPGLLALLAGFVLGAPVPGPGTSALFLAAFVLSATSFAALALLLEAQGRARELVLGGVLAAYVVLGPAWREAFLAGGGGLDGLGASIVYRASPVAAARWSLAEASGLGLLVIAAWSLAGLAAAGWIVQRSGFPRATTQHN